MASKLSFPIFLLLVLSCKSDDMPFDDTPVDNTNLVGEWLLNATYISPGGTTEWKVAQEGYRYFFDESGNYRLTDFNKNMQETGEYEIKKSELYLYFFTEGEKDTLGFSADFNEDKTMLTLSPSYPAICIEGCLYRFKKE